MSLPDLKGRVAVITGASRGLGAGLASDFLARGMKLGLCARSAIELPEGSGAIVEQLDVSDEASLERFTQRVQEHLGDIDLWVNNAGVLDPIAPLRDVSVESFRNHVDINLTGVFLGTRIYANHVRGRGGAGVLINVSSGAAWMAYEGWSAYCAAKSGVERLTECVALEERDHGLRAYSVAPGVVDTDMQARIRECTEAEFPEVERFRSLKRDGGFNTVPWVAEHLLRIAFDPGAAPESVAHRIPDEKA